MSNKIEIRQVRGLAGKNKKQITTVKSLGLGKLNKTVILENTPSISGMIKKVSHLVNYREL